MEKSGANETQLIEVDDATSKRSRTPESVPQEAPTNARPRLSNEQTYRPSTLNTVPSVSITPLGSKVILSVRKSQFQIRQPNSGGSQQSAQPSLPAEPVPAAQLGYDPPQDSFPYEQYLAPATTYAQTRNPAHSSQPGHSAMPPPPRAISSTAQSTVPPLGPAPVAMTLAPAPAPPAMAPAPAPPAMAPMSLPPPPSAPTTALATVTASTPSLPMPPPPPFPSTTAQPQTALGSMQCQRQPQYPAVPSSWERGASGGYSHVGNGYAPGNGFYPGGHPSQAANPAQPMLSEQAGPSSAADFHRTQFSGRHNGASRNDKVSYQT